MSLQKPISRAEEKRTKARQKLNAWLSVRKDVLSRDGYKCRACGARDGLDAHHIKFRSAGGQDTTANVAVLCRVCHADMHAYRLFVTGTNADKALTFTREGGR